MKNAVFITFLDRQTSAKILGPSVKNNFDIW